MKKLCLYLTALVLFAVPAVCFAEKIELVVFAAASMTETLTEIAELYKEAAPDIDLIYTFDSSGTLRYDAHVVNGQVVDAYGNPIDGCYVNENGNVMDAYWNEIDPHTGTLAQ